MPDLETLIASTLYLMTRHSQSSKSDVEQTIIDHLKLIANHPNCNSKVLKEAGGRLSMIWQQEARVKELGLEKCNHNLTTRNPNAIH